MGRSESTNSCRTKALASASVGLASDKYARVSTSDKGTGGPALGAGQFHAARTEALNLAEYWT